MTDRTIDINDYASVLLDMKQVCDRKGIEFRKVMMSLAMDWLDDHDNDDEYYVPIDECCVQGCRNTKDGHDMCGTHVTKWKLAQRYTNLSVDEWAYLGGPTKEDAAIKLRLVRDSIEYNAVNRYLRQHRNRRTK